MKHKILTTSKAEIFVCELPEGATELYITRDNWLQYKNSKGVLRHHQLYKNWQPLTFDEVAAGKIVDFKHIKSEHPCEQCGFDVECYRNYLEQSEDDWKNIPTADRCYSALESLQSLIDANVQKVNPLGDYPTKENSGLEYGMQYISKVISWEEAEENTYHNPFYFFKLK